MQSSKLLSIRELNTTIFLISKYTTTVFLYVGPLYQKDLNLKILKQLHIVMIIL